MQPTILATVVCPHCHADVDATQDDCPACRAPLAGSSTSDSVRLYDRPWFIVVLLLHVGFLGIPMYWQARYSVAIRVGICLASIFYTVFVIWFVAVVGSMLWRMLHGG